MNNGYIFNIDVLIKTKDVLEDLVKKYGFSYVNIQNEVRKNSRYSIAIASLKRTFSVLPVAWQPFLAKCSGLFV